MAIYKCNYSVVEDTGKNVEQDSDKMKKYLGEFHNTNLPKALEPWDKTNDTARPLFDEKELGIYNYGVKAAEYGEALGKHIQKCSRSIKALDQELAKLKI